MTELLFRILLPMGLAGSVLYLALLLLRPLTRRLDTAFRRGALLVVCALLLLPLPLVFTVSQAQAPAQQQTLNNALRNTPATAPVYHAGEALGNNIVSLPEELPTQPNELPATNAQVVPPTAPSSLFFAFTPVHWVALVYFAGLFVLVAIFAAQYVLLAQWLRKRCEPEDNLEIIELYEKICCEMNIRRRPLLLRSAALHVPVLSGLLRAKIILPAGNLSPAAAAFALRHELTHHARHDLLCKMLLLGANLLHWYNPLAFLLRREFEAVCEENCDATVAKAMDTTTRMAYASCLLNFAAAPVPYMLSSFSSPVRQLKKRLEGITKPASPKKRIKAVGITGLCLLTVTGLLAGCSLSAGVSAASTTVSSLPVSSPSVSPASSASAPASSSASARAPASVSSAETSATPLVYPVPGGKRSGRGFVQNGHRGRDVNAAEGEPIVAAADGEVIFVGFLENQGNMILLYHKELEMYTSYSHCEELLVEKNSTINQGDTIATLGSTGVSSGSHCHFEVILNDGGIDIIDETISQTGTLVDPDLYLPSQEAHEQTVSALASENHIWPVEDGTLILRDNANSSHRGIDISAKLLTPILATNAGTVITAQEHDSYGNYVVIEHPDGLTTLYAHCDTLLVEKGQSVQQGDQIATVGSSGNTENPVCHLEFLQNDKLLNVLEYITPPA